jgi:carbon starvation protein
MHALYLVIPALAVGVIGYRYYSAFIAAKALSLDDSRETPSHQKYDGANFYPTPRWVLFGHHFAPDRCSARFSPPSSDGRRDSCG